MAFNDLVRHGASAAGKYEIEKSLRFNSVDSPYLSRTPSGSGTIGTWTLSCWIKRNKLGTTQYIYFSGAVNQRGGIYFSTDDKLYIQPWNGSGTNKYIVSKGVFRDVGAWMHLCIKFPAVTQANIGSAAYIWTDNFSNYFDTYTTGSPPADDRINDGQLKHIGAITPTAASYGDFQLAEFHFLDNVAANASDFAETDAVTGQWVPKKYTGSYGTNGYYLNFSDNSGTTATTLGKDSSGNGNNWTPSGFSVAAGKDDDSLNDTPTNNYPTLSSYDGSSVGTISNGNLRVSYNYKPASKTWRAPMALPTTGKFYWEWENEEASSNPGRWNTGLVRYTSEAQTYDHQGYNDADYFSVSYGGSMWNGTTHINPSWSSNPTFYSGERVAIAIDCSTGKVWVGKVATGGGTTWYDDDGTTDGDPAGGTNETCTITGFSTGRWVPYIGWHDGGSPVTATFTSNINFGNHSFLGTPPAGFKNLCSQNLSAPSINIGTDHFISKLYTGNDSDLTVTGVGFQPDVVMGRCRSDAIPVVIFDSVRGDDKQLDTNTTAAETVRGSAAYRLLSDGFRVTTVGNLCNPQTYVAWCWKGAGGTASNGSGSVTATVSANASAGFSAVAWTGTAGVDTIGHGLGVAPELIIVKKRDATDNWVVFCSADSGMGADKQMYLDLTNAIETNANIFNDAPTSTVFTVGSWSSTATMMAYCFASVEGYSKVGTYTGNNNADGPFIYTGFKPQWVATKGTWGSNWNIFDNKRPSEYYNVTNDRLFFNLANAEIDGSPTDNQVDLLSNGFKMRGNNDDTNKAAGFIYLALAEAPFKYANAG